MILMLAGTSDARELAVRIKGAGYELLATVVTESAAKSLEEAGIPVQTGRLDAAGMAELIRSRGFRTVVDASHPFAEEASRQAMAAALQTGVPYIRYERERGTYEGHQRLLFVDDYEQAAELAASRRGVIMLTTGSKTLHIFAERLIGLPDTTLVARMLPRKDNMEKCEQLGIEQKNIVAMQGPFSKELNQALYRHYGVTTVITKESGKIGAVEEKLAAALEMNIDTIVIGRPQLDYGVVYSEFDGVLDELNHTLREAR
ncbi:MULTISPECIES: precorrin-6A reductase [Paenibacillus]|uniref:Precorrin-6x reductase n=1 Tax=Paenibacillus naphthalenovorans TaxID=162209 RepID=A0A0U2W7Z9_9BACL|nr:MULTISPECIES: precorrin-6A reductase [Paenibacillus]ALS23533.1 precorrin-6x reductase [Paenibacillus naphthalenovorans]NTZ20632.1 precorrin-6A reductase [Paenibacillus sp. JMULE4]GCL74401.1 precorrin-6A reductase [Paenibacillus naphthalenovorans]SDJ02986.1 precorrin-6A/cobalt-precorrin-6A reductase [Paenibacillus naphthalenovorans]